jgi:hypothetical protein
VAVTLTDEQAKNLAASLRSGTGALTSLADILDPPVAPTPPSRKWLDPRALRLHRTKAWCLITIPRRDESAPGGWHRPAAFMVRSAFVEPDSELGAPSSLGLGAVLAPDAPSAVKHRPADVVSQPLVVKD